MSDATLPAADRQRLTDAAVKAASRALSFTVASHYRAYSGGRGLGTDPDWRSIIAEAYRAVSEHTGEVAARHEAKANAERKAAAS